MDGNLGSCMAQRLALLFLDLQPGFDSAEWTELSS